MKNPILYSMLLFVLLSCAQTKIDSESNKAVHWLHNDDIVSNQKIHEASFWTRQYKSKEVFPDDQEAQLKLDEANKFRRYEAYSIWAFIATSIYYSNNNQDSIATQKNNSNLIFLAAVAPAIYFMTKGHKKAEEAVNHYNKVKGYSLYPVIQQDNRNNKIGLIFSSSF